MTSRTHRRSFASGFIVAGTLSLAGGFYFQLFWNEAIDVDLGSFAANTQHFLKPRFSGVSTLLGVPVYDFASGVGYRYPINYGLPQSGFALFRHLLPANLIWLLAFALALGLALTAVNLALHELDQSRFRVLLSSNIILCAPILFLLIDYDYYFNALGYCALVGGAATLCVPISDLDSVTSRMRLFVGVLAVFFGTTTGAPYLVLALWPLVLFRLRHVVRLLYNIISNRQGLAVLSLAVAGITSSLTPVAILLIRFHHLPFRTAISSFLSILDGSMNSFKHVVGMAIVRDLPGVFYLIDQIADTSFVAKYYGGLFRTPSGITSLIVLTTLSMLGGRRNRKHLLVCLFSFAIAAVFAQRSDDFIPIWISWRDAYLLVPFVFSTILLGGSIGDVGSSVAVHTRRGSSLVLSFLLFVSAGTGILFAVQNRTIGFTTFAPTKNGALTSIVQKPTERFESLLEESGHRRGYRLLSVTDNFRYQVFEKKELFTYYGLFGWSDLRESGFPVISYGGFSGSAVLKEAIMPKTWIELNLDGLDSKSGCQLAEFEFLSIFSVMSDESFRETCGNSNWISTPLLDPESRLPGPVYVNRPRSFHSFGSEVGANEICPFLDEDCVSQLKLETLNDSPHAFPPLYITESGENKAVYRLPGNLTAGPRLLVLPIAYDHSIEILSAQTNERVTGIEFAGFVSLDRSALQHLAGTDLLIQIAPDAEMIFVAILPWFWLIIVILLLYSGVNFVKSRTVREHSGT